MHNISYQANYEKISLLLKKYIQFSKLTLFYDKYDRFKGTAKVILNTEENYTKLMDCSGKLYLYHRTLFFKKFVDYRRDAHKNKSVPTKQTQSISQNLNKKDIIIEYENKITNLEREVQQLKLIIEQNENTLNLKFNKLNLKFLEECKNQKDQNENSKFLKKNLKEETNKIQSYYQLEKNDEIIEIGFEKLIKLLPFREKESENINWKSKTLKDLELELDNYQINQLKNSPSWKVRKYLKIVTIQGNINKQQKYLKWKGSTSILKLRTFTNYLNRYSYVMNEDKSKFCKLCKKINNLDIIEDLDHFLWNCPAYENNRKIWISELKNINISHILKKQ
ncbi:tho complex subunit 4a [Anaeramoeba flamelloides]|uniref:Tho complex subunit 4a n=1 Tax=Anaeramoeba flamelloides TaxID=1746091 RepID=A0ABQ8XKL0_9EUKA|nr:tho complex subunit 4a [Anaeramoeba flamelloides]